MAHQTQQTIDKVARFILGVLFLFFGLNGFFNFLPTPPMSDEAKNAYGVIFFLNPSLLPLIKLTEISCAVLFLLNRYVVLATLLIAPIAVNIALFHIFLEPNGRLFPLIIISCLSVIVLYRKNSYQPLFKRS
jgi:putative oxidoreductase